MVRLFAKEEDKNGAGFTIIGSDVNHVRNVLRMKAGDAVQISTESDRVYNCEIAGFQDCMLQLAILSEEEAATELKAEIRLYQGIPKGDKFETILQKAVELGADAVIPVEMKRCVVKVDPKKAEARLKRYAAISEAAAKQSKRNRIPEVGPYMTMRQAIDSCRTFDHIFIPYENAVNMEETKKLFAAVRPGERIAVFIGPEGGFEEAEVQAVIEAGGHAVTLGKRILRTETAGMTVLSILMFGLEQ
ncbi:MAG: 16S rRNA (uracil(1498)-N(3))-methyltransferase [Lachnospiraceae bacterium]|nr:16S rRNA (uracil(1498)-N(3))-methyltransferase [Lachnospiraceae bacterium]